MNISSNAKIAFFSIAILVGFLSVWLWLARKLLPWGDELYHLSAAEGLMQTGRPIQALVDLCGGLSTSEYHRAIEVTRWVTWSYDIFGESVASARVVPLIFVIATWVLYVGYTRWRHYSSPKQILVVTVLFFSQAMILETAVYLRMYGPLLFFFLLAMIGIWEGMKQIQTRKFYLAAPWLAIAVLALIYTSGWHLIHFPIMVLAIVVLGMMYYWNPPEHLLRETWVKISHITPLRKYLLLAILITLAILVVVIGPRVVDTAGVTLINSQRVHLTPWDNIFSLVRLLLVTNILLWVWWKFNRTGDRLKSFNAWLLTTGVISGFAIAILMNQHWIFYTRYLTISVGLIALGGSMALANVKGKYLLGGVIGIYLVLNGLVATSTYAAERADINQGIEWLIENTTDKDVILALNPRLAYYENNEICDRTRLINIPGVVDATSNSGKGLGYTRRSGDYPFMTGDDMLTLIESKPIANIYFIYENPHGFRDNLYKWTTGRQRSPINSLFTLFRDGDVADDIGPGLHASGLKKIDRKKLVAALESRNFP